MQELQPSLGRGEIHRAGPCISKPRLTILLCYFLHFRRTSPYSHCRPRPCFSDSIKSTTYGYGYPVYDMDGPPQAVTELDLSACHPDSIVDRINAMPALKTSTVTFNIAPRLFCLLDFTPLSHLTVSHTTLCPFFTFLRANLVLPHSAMSSNPSTPNLAPTRPLPRRSSPTPQSSRPATPVPTILDDDDIPPLTLEVLSTKQDKTAALKLIADSIAQQRQTASSHIIFHPLPLSCLIAALVVTYRYFLSESDLGTCLMILSSVVTTYLLAIRWLTSPFIRLAESITPSFLNSSTSSTEEEDTVIACRYGNEIIGATVLHISRPGGGQNDPNFKRHKQRGSLSSFKGGKGVIRAWTVKLRYRGKGIGGDMLREAVRLTKEKCGKDGEVGFARGHANAGLIPVGGKGEGNGGGGGRKEEEMVLPEWLNRGWLRKSERRAAQALEKVVGEVGNGKRR
ncbi:hypothetical protein QBC40DRAFT_309583 [Triangularia verruculosa]|uniref:N-acetyltransferase domain-containing protein n=1 Tax=Triangularia verruculosa TaxID=2587418 RepID=A0AAN6XA60_9PEZI|nr:hypothetical protein QBC40DRAFT_309583 [Triangularia verruculosa]